jgi:hypothetical protein
MHAVAQLAPSPSSAWSVRLVSSFRANDDSAKQLLTGLTESQLNWQAAPTSWSIGQCLDHLCATTDAYLPALLAALKNQPDSPVDNIRFGWFSGWFFHSFVEPSPSTKRASAPAKIRPASNVSLAVLSRFLAGNQSCRDLLLAASSKNVNRIRFWNPFIPGLRFTVGTGLAIIPAHQRRHFLQAERVRSSPNFPQ